MVIATILPRGRVLLVMALLAGSTYFFPARVQAQSEPAPVGC